MKGKIYFTCLLTMLFTACGQAAESQQTITKTSGSTFQYRVDLNALAQHKYGVSDGMVDTIKSLIAQRLEKKGITGYQISAGISDTSLITLAISEPNQLSAEQAQSLIAPVHLSVKEQLQVGDPAPKDEWQETAVSEKQIEAISVYPDPAGNSYSIAITLNQEGKEQFAQITKRNIGQPLGIFLDDVLITQPIVQSEITAGELLISSAQSLKEKIQLANSLKLSLYRNPIVSLVSIR